MSQPDEQGSHSRLDLLRGMTLDAAQEADVADMLGSIEPGKLADLVVLSANPLAVEAPDALVVERTLISGATIYSRR